MSGHKHTPAPWRAMLDDSNPDEPRLAVMAGSRIVSETVIHGSDEASRREAASPRLAEALKRMLNNPRPDTANAQYHPEVYPDAEAAKAAEDEARAALDKVKDE